MDSVSDVHMEFLMKTCEKLSPKSVSLKEYATTLQVCKLGVFFGPYLDTFHAVCRLTGTYRSRGIL